MTALTVEAIIEKVDALTAALTRVADNQDRLIAGQAAALEKIEPAKTTRAPRGSKAKEEAAPAATETPAEPATEKEKSALPSFADLDKFKAWVQEWTGGLDEATRKTAVTFLNNVAGKFGGSGFSGAFSGGPKAVFLIARARALGVDAVDLEAAYDFDGDPEQEVAGAAASEDDFG